MTLSSSHGGGGDKNPSCGLWLGDQRCACVSEIKVLPNLRGSIFREEAPSAPVILLRSVEPFDAFIVVRSHFKAARGDETGRPEILHSVTSDLLGICAPDTLPLHEIHGRRKCAGRMKAERTRVFVCLFVCLCCRSNTVGQMGSSVCTNNVPCNAF